MTTLIHGLYMAYLWVIYFENLGGNFELFWCVFLMKLGYKNGCSGDVFW